DGIQHPAIAVADPQGLPMATIVVEVPRPQLPTLRVKADPDGPRSNYLVIGLFRELAEQEGLLLVPGKRQGHFLVLERRFPLTGEPVQVLQSILAHAPLARHGNLPLIAFPDMNDAIQGRSREFLAIAELSLDAFLDGQVGCEEANRVDDYFDLVTRFCLEKS